MMLACGEGRRRGRPIRRWMNEIHEVTGMKLAELRDATIERKQRRRLVVVVARFPGRVGKNRDILKKSRNRIFLNLNRIFLI